MLRLQAEEFRQLAADREREEMERRRAQAVLVYFWRTWEDDGEFTYHVRNTSRQPVYHLALEKRAGFPEGKTTWQLRMEPLMPGEEDISSSSDYRDPTDVIAATFCDSAGVWWHIRESAVPDELLPPIPPGILPRKPDRSGVPDPENHS
jgi:hypothetical protein